MIYLHYEQATNYKYDVLKVILCSKKASLFKLMSENVSRFIIDNNDSSPLHSFQYLLLNKAIVMNNDYALLNWGKEERDSLYARYDI